MQLDIKTLCQYRLERAKEDLMTAENNHHAGFYKAAINRSYYAIFHSIRAVNVLDNFDASKHSSVIAHFNQFFIHTGKFERDAYKLVDSAYRIREKCDYSDFFIVSKTDSQIQLKHAHDFVNNVLFMGNMVEIYLNRKFFSRWSKNGCFLWFVQYLISKNMPKKFSEMENNEAEDNKEI